MKLYFFLIIFLISACSDKVKRSLPNTASSEMKEMLATANPDFQDGWRDGCETGTSAGANWFYKSIYKSNRVDGYRIMDSKDYQVAWNFGWWYCYRYQSVKNKSSLWGSFTSGYR